MPFPMPATMRLLRIALAGGVTAGVLLTGCVPATHPTGAPQAGCAAAASAPTDQPDPGALLDAVLDDCTTTTPPADLSAALLSLTGRLHARHVQPHAPHDGAGRAAAVTLPDGGIDVEVYPSTAATRRAVDGWWAAIQPGTSYLISGPWWTATTRGAAAAEAVSQLDGTTLHRHTP